MKVLIVAHHVLPHIGGPEILVDREVRALVADGHRVTVIASDLLGAGETPRYPDTVRVWRVSAWHVLEQRFHLPYPIFSPRLFAVLWREIGQCDVVHAHGFLFMNSALALLLARLRGRHCLLTDHGGLQRYRSRIANLLARLGVASVGRLSARCANQLVTFNTRITRLLERLSGTRAKTLFLPNPVDRDLFRPATQEQRWHAREGLGWNDNRAKVLFVGRLVADKGVRLLVQATDAAYDLAFCGPGDPNILGPLPRPGVEYLPPRKQAEMVALYHAADLLVLPSYREGFPLVVQEALACGVKVVMSDDEGYGPYRDLPGLSFCPLEPAGIRNAICSALQAPAAPTDPAILDRCCPSLTTWVRRLYENVPGMTPQPASAPPTVTYTWAASAELQTVQAS